jgi:acyl-CoA thioesterase I
MLQRLFPHLKLGIFGSNTTGASAAGEAVVPGVAVGAGGSAFEQATSKESKTMRFIGPLILALAACRQPTTPPAASARYLAMGDSFTIGTGSSPGEAFPSRLVERWRGSGCDVELRNVAVNGYTTEDVIREELPVLEKYRPTFVTIAAGANDIVQGRSEEEYRASLRRIFSALKASHARVVALPQPDWSQSPVASAFGDRAIIAKNIRRYDAILAEEARASGATFIDVRPEPGVVARDGLHPSASAHDAWANEIVKALGTLGTSDACRSSP